MDKGPQAAHGRADGLAASAGLNSPALHSLTERTSGDRVSEASAVKRTIDVIGALAVLVPALPVMALVAVVCLVTQGRPILHVAMRAGQAGRPIRVAKFRTMTVSRDNRGALLPDAARLTRWGRWLRATSLDELPELLAVLRGDMSLVGPRPLPIAYLPRYEPWQARRHEVRPGLTGWAQVNGRNSLGWDERFALDVWYVDNQSLRVDFRILARTVTQIARREGISHEGHVTMHEFLGREAAE